MNTPKKELQNIALPPRDYYTLKQAIDYLKAMMPEHQQSIIDESYFLQLGAAGKIVLSLPTLGKAIAVEPQVSDSYLLTDHEAEFDYQAEYENFKHLHFAHFLRRNFNYYLLFYSIRPLHLMEMSHVGEIKVSHFVDPVIYDPYSMLINLQDFEFDPIQGCDINQAMERMEHRSHILRVQDTVKERFITGNFIQCFFGSKVYFGFKDDSESNQKLLDIKITANDLYVTYPELERIINQDFTSYSFDELMAEPMPKVVIRNAEDSVQEDKSYAKSKRKAREIAEAVWQRYPDIFPLPLAEEIHHFLSKGMYVPKTAGTVRDWIVDLDPLRTKQDGQLKAKTERNGKPTLAERTIPDDIKREIFK
ncbi:MAG: hypothetical protein KGO49_13450 [Gammaproteobacteria bacterium]|nr:hypothetical protein [Gammaproteobacteria bacterium]